MIATGYRFGLSVTDSRYRIVYAEIVITQAMRGVPATLGKGFPHCILSKSKEVCRKEPN
jgi:hypothetical protein